jgi:hypothetical protein
MHDELVTNSDDTPERNILKARQCRSVCRQYLGMIILNFYSMTKPLGDAGSLNG